MNIDQLMEYFNQISVYIQNYQPPIQIIFNNDFDDLIASCILGRVFYELKTPCVITQIQDTLETTIKPNFSIIFLNSEPISEEIDQSIKLVSIGLLQNETWIETDKFKLVNKIIN